MIKIDEELELAKQAALQAGLFLRQNQSEISITKESGRDIKLNADVQSQKIILEVLENSAFEVLSEEKPETWVDHGIDYYWIVDPLDGSLNYSRHIPLCCISIALWRENEPILGVVYDLFNDDLYTGIVGTGAWCNEHSIHTSSIEEKNKAIICTGFPVYLSHETKDLNNFILKIQGYKKTRLLGSAALSLAFVARGWADAYAEEAIAIWDVAAGIALVKASGGIANYTFTKNIGNVFCDNGKIRSQLC
ncbi:inositol monophosphatase [Akkermansiaceae bacterium]|nr:inositol monophosphatase [Akkermansiaceae bacterium]